MISFTDFRLGLLEKKLCVYGASVYQNGETQHLRLRADDKVNVYSVAKTFTGVAAGIAADEGLLRITDPVSAYFPEYESIQAEGTEQITIRDLLHMASGKPVFWTSFGDKALLKTDYAELFFREPLRYKPDEMLFYSNICTYMVGRIIERTSGCNSLRDYLVPRLFDVLEIPNPQWFSCPRGHTLAATGLFLTTGEMLRLGVLLLNGGEYNGKRVVSGEHVAAMANDVFDTSGLSAFPDPEWRAGYGYYIWRSSVPGVYRADGKYGQYVIVAPEKNAAIAVTSHEEICAEEILRLVYSTILEKL